MLNQQLPGNSQGATQNPVSSSVPTSTTFEGPQVVVVRSSSGGLKHAGTHFPKAPKQRAATQE